MRCSDVCVCVCVSQVSYHETGPSRDDSNSLSTAATNATLEALLPGRNYTFTVTPRYHHQHHHTITPTHHHNSYS